MNENPSLVLNGEPGGLAPRARRPVATGSADPAWQPLADYVPIAPAASPLPAYLHAFRRRWLPALLLGLLVGAAAGIGVFLLRGPVYTPKAYLRVALSQPEVMDRPQRTANLPNAYDIYKDTQAQLIRSPFVLRAALQRPEVRDLSIVARETAPAAWLEDKLAVRFPGRAEIMEVSLRSDHKVEATTLVNAVVQTYLSEVVDVERNQRTERLNQLDRAHTEKESELRDRLTVLRSLAEGLGTADQEALRIKQQLAVQELAHFRGELNRVQGELRRTLGDVAAMNEMLAKIDDLEISLYEVDTLLRYDPVASDIAKELSWRRSAQAYTDSVLRPEAREKHGTRGLGELQALEAMFEQRAGELREGVRGMKRRELQEKLIEKEIAASYLVQQERQMATELQEKQVQAERLGGSSIDLEMLRSEVDQLGKVLADITAERERIRVDMRSAPRVTSVQPAEEPLVEDGLVLRLALVVLAGLGGFCAPVVLITLWDAQGERVNTLADVSKGLGLPVAGAIPEIPARVLRRLGSSRRAQSKWQLRLTEAVDGVAARLLSRSDGEGASVVLISSAVSGEGKSTLAMQLAASLARNGRSTVLVDFALRRPAFHNVFGIPLEPGISEVLRGECELSGVVRETAADNLAVIPAGSWDRKALSALANGACRTLLEELRSKHDFVVIDSSPLLPVADTRFVSQHADLVLLSVLRDVSQTPRIREAIELLEAFGATHVEAVVTGAGGNADHRSLALHRPAAS